MTVEHDRTKEPQTLPDEEARRLLARASEIESGRSAELSLADLREAASEAGIAPNAFEQALVEFRDRHPVSDSEPAQLVPTTVSRFPIGVVNVLKTVAVVLGTLFFLMLLVDFL